jgi:hypothetical protein
VHKVIAFGAGSAIAAAVCAAVLGAGPAAAAPSAADAIGQKYSDASNAISKGGGSAVVATRVGDQVGQDDCLVTNAQLAPFLRDGTTYAKSNGEVMLSLNCEAPVASAVDPGNSAASEIGRKTLAAQAEQQAQAQQNEQDELANAGQTVGAPGDHH